MKWCCLALIVVAFAAGVAVGLGLANLPSNAVRAVFRNREGEEEMFDLTMHVGDAPFPLTLALLKPDESIDDTYENPVFGYDDPDSGVLTAVDGSSSVTLDGGVDVTVTALAPSASDGSTVIPSTFLGKADSAADAGGPLQKLVIGTLRITVLPANVDADHAEFRPRA